jgi:2-haloalkanoic acid dehalogenase type II
MTERWVTFDCYGTLIDWNRGIGDALQRLWPDADLAALLRCYHEVEPKVQAGGARPYREVLGLCTQGVGAELGLRLPVRGETALAASLPSWPPFPEVPGALEALRDAGWRLAVLSNTDPDLLAASLVTLDVPVDLTITVAEAGSYKPAPGHWQAFRSRSRTRRDRHVHVGASLYHDIAPCAELGIAAVWINRLGETSDLARAAELPDCGGLPATLARLIPQATADL